MGFKAGYIPWNKNINGYSTSRKGQKHSEETKQKISLHRRGKATGEGNGAWNNGSSKERHRLMGQIEYKLWRIAVFTRDDYTCQFCEVKGGKLEADHIKPWALYPELRYAIDNGRTLCVPCHRQTDTWGGKNISIMRGGE